ncbi:MAG: hypothetical protein ACRCV5_04600, partial [Afipia sp.]
MLLVRQLLGSQNEAVNGHCTAYFMLHRAKSRANKLRLSHCRTKQAVTLNTQIGLSDPIAVAGECAVRLRAS